MIYTIENGILTVKINSYGAEMCSVIKDGSERLWQNGDGSWNGHAIALFPFCSVVEVWVDGKLYPNVIHGFASSSEFVCVNRTAESLTLRLEQNEETKKHYPYDFRLDISFILDGDKIRIEHHTYNPMDIPLPYAIGAHESYAIDRPIEEYYLEFEKDEHFLNRKTKETVNKFEDLGHGGILKLNNGFFKNDASLIFLGIKSRWIRLCKADGSPVARVDFDEKFVNAVFWKTESGSYICMEPWMSICDMAETDKKTEFAKKDGILSVAPKTEDVRIHTVTYY